MIRLNNILVRSFQQLSVSGLLVVLCTIFSTGMVNAQTSRSILEFGAIADDTVDDTDAFEAALSALKPGQELYVPTGEYCISRPLLVQTDNIQITGAGTTSKLVFNNARDYYAEYGTRVGIINIIANNITVRDLNIDQNFRESTKTDGEAASIGGIILGGKYLGKPTKTYGITVKDCTFYDYYGDAVSAFNAFTSGLTVQNCSFVSSYIVGGWSDAGVKGEQAISVASGADILIENNVIEGALDDAIAIHNNNKNVEILNNRITTTGGRILVNGTENGRIAGNEIVYIQDGGCAIYLSYSVKSKGAALNNTVVIENNTIRINDDVKFEAGIKLFGGGENLSIINNRITGNGTGTGILIKDRKSRAADFRYFAKNVLVKENVIVDCASGIMVDDRQKNESHYSVNLQNNTIKNAGKGIVTSQNMTIANNTFENVLSERDGMTETKASPVQVPDAAEDGLNTLVLDRMRFTEGDPSYLSQIIKPKSRISFMRVIGAGEGEQRVEVIDVKNKRVMGTFTSEGVLDIPLKVNRQYRIKIITDRNDISLVKFEVS